jgi:hypothetical protein
MTDIAKKPTPPRKKLPSPGRKLSRKEAIDKAIKKFPETLAKLAK